MSRFLFHLPYFADKPHWSPTLTRTAIFLLPLKEPTKVVKLHPNFTTLWGSWGLFNKKIPHHPTTGLSIPMYKHLFFPDLRRLSKRGPSLTALGKKTKGLQEWAYSLCMTCLPAPPHSIALHELKHDFTRNGRRSQAVVVAAALINASSNDNILRRGREKRLRNRTIKTPGNLGKKEGSLINPSLPCFQC